MAWTVGYTEEYLEWWKTLDASDRRRVLAAVEVLREMGPATPRPVVDQISGSQYPNMKELRAGTLRILFAFDPQRTAVLLIGGNKRGQWSKWYAEMIPRAERLFAQHLATLRTTGERDDDTKL